MKRIQLFLKSFPMAGGIFYVPSQHQFIHVKAMYLTGIECGGFCEYYSDAKTTITRQFLSYGLLSKCLLVNHIDKFQFAQPEKIGKNHLAWKAI